MIWTTSEDERQAIDDPNVYFNDHLHERTEDGIKQTKEDHDMLECGTLLKLIIPTNVAREVQID